jgi:glyoxylase-like metal-dependent hydrolase (beta-lactamase superfamily II)
MKIFDNLYGYIWNDVMENNCNSYIIGGEIPLLIDPGHDRFLTGLVELMDKDGINPEDISLIITTHSHPDHIEANGNKRWNSTLKALNKEEDVYFKEVYPIFGEELPSFTIDFYLQEGELKVGDNTFQIIHTPGHTPGSICIYWPQNKTLISGDVIFAGGVGRTDFPGGDGKLLKKSIGRLSNLDIEYLLCGHGDILKGRDRIKRNFGFIEATFFDFL